MKGLILKDFMNLRQQWKVFAIILTFYAFISMAGKNTSMFGFMIIVICATLPTTLMSYDERAKWDKYALSMPLSRTDMVISKYIMSMIFFIIAFLLTTLFSILADSTSISDILLGSSIFCVIGISYVSISLPILFKYGVEKSRLIVMIIFFIPIGIIIFLLKTGMNLPDKQTLNILTSISPFIVIAIFIISILISLNIYKRKEL